jgi:RNA polymerase sigma-70 factor (ECF subfamily)
LLFWHRNQDRETAALILSKSTLVKRNRNAYRKAAYIEKMANEHGPSDLNKEDPLESLLDDETDEEFGAPRFQEHFADSLTPAVLKDWSARDFASIYIRFRPHLERHAKRFLVNPSQVEEVVQDAFLYLMTTLPELDSELGVLKFLKWKTRLLALDVIRANSRVSIAPFDVQREFEADIPEMGQELERADDAAIVSLALAKLQPRHREALIATLYEEKSAEVVSAQMGLSENAFRQLLFRSRAAFKKALIGEAEISGLSMSEVLSVAARKAAAESGKLASVAGAFLLVLALSFGVIPNLTSNVSEETVSLPQSASAESQGIDHSSPAPAGESSESDQNTSGEPQPIEAEALLEPATSATLTSETQIPSENDVLAQATQDVVLTEPVAQAAESQPQDSAARVLATSNLREAMGSSTAVKLASLGNTALPAGNYGPKGSLKINTGSGFTGAIDYDLYSETGIDRVWFIITVDRQEFISAPNVTFAQKTLNQDGTTTVSYIATDLLIGDKSGEYDFIAINDTVVSRSAVTANLVFDSEGSLIKSSISLTPRT